MCTAPISGIDPEGSPTLKLCLLQANLQTSKLMRKAYLKQCEALKEAAKANNGGKLPIEW